MNNARPAETLSTDSPGCSGSYLQNRRFSCQLVCGLCVSDIDQLRVSRYKFGGARAQRPFGAAFESVCAMAGVASSDLQNTAWTISQHCEKYCQAVKTQQAVLQKLWDDLELSPDLQTQQLLVTARKAEAVWQDAVHAAETQRDAVREQIEEAHRRVAKIQAELADEAFPDAEVGLIRETELCRRNAAF